MGEPRCQRCAAPAAGVVAVSELDRGARVHLAAEVLVCAPCMAGVARALGFTAYVSAAAGEALHG